MWGAQLCYVAFLVIITFWWNILGCDKSIDSQLFQQSVLEMRNIVFFVYHDLREFYLIQRKLRGG